MITQGIKRWLHSLFAWWPWKHSPETNSAQNPGIVNKGTTQETLFRVAGEGPTTQPAQPNTTSVAIEPIEGQTISEMNWRPEERLDPSVPLTRFVPSPESSTIPPSSSEEITGQAKDERELQDTPTPQQRLEFLRYLVQRGIVSDYPDEK